MNKLIAYLALFAAFGFGLLAVKYSDWFSNDALAPGEIRFIGENRQANQNQNENIEAVEYEVEEFASGLDVPWSIVFTSENRILLTERPGNIRVIENGNLKPEALHRITEVVSDGEEGLMGLTLDPEYKANKYIYVSYAYRSSGALLVKVVRLKDNGDSLTEPKTIIEKIPAAVYHAGSRLKFGPDKKLYITTGDASQKELAQNLSSLAGKILRLNADGSIPKDNPFPDSPVWTYGHRNPQGIDWQSENGEMYSSEHGPSGFDGPGGGDEINRLVKGGNYGWPLVSHEKTKEDTIAPLQLFTPAEAPASLLVYSGKVLPQFRYNLFFGALKGQGLVRLVLDPNDANKIISVEKLKEVAFGRIREVIEGPDGYIYFSTSNRDGRGDPAKNDDRIFRLKPKN